MMHGTVGRHCQMHPTQYPHAELTVIQASPVMRVFWDVDSCLGNIGGFVFCKSMVAANRLCIDCD
jgi:hypothetical protein